MTPVSGSGEPAEPKITIEDVKQRAAAVRDLAKSEAKAAANVVLHEKATQAVLVGVVAVVALTSLAYYLGTRSRGRRLPPGYHA